MLFCTTPQRSPISDGNLPRMGTTCDQPVGARTSSSLRMPSCTVMIMESSRSMSSRVRSAIPFALFCAPTHATCFESVWLEHSAGEDRLALDETSPHAVEGGQSSQLFKGTAADCSLAPTRQAPVAHATADMEL